MIKVSFNNVQFLYEKSKDGSLPFECLHVYTYKVGSKFLNGLNLMVIEGYIGYIRFENIKSIEHVKPSEV